MEKYKAEKKYCIYEISDEGHLTVPMAYEELIFSNDIYQNSSFNSIEKAKEAIIKESKAFGGIYYFDSC